MFESPVIYMSRNPQYPIFVLQWSVLVMASATVPLNVNWPLPSSFHFYFSLFLLRIRYAITSTVGYCIWAHFTTLYCNTRITLSKLINRRYMYSLRKCTIQPALQMDKTNIFFCIAYLSTLYKIDRQCPAHASWPPLLKPRGNSISIKSAAMLLYLVFLPPVVTKRPLSLWNNLTIQ